MVVVWWCEQLESLKHTLEEERRQRRAAEQKVRRRQSFWGSRCVRAADTWHV